MTVYSVWPYFVCMALLLAIASTRLFSAADTPPNPKGPRISTLDGLRGFLALGVFFHHAAIYYLFLRDGRWQVPPSIFYMQLGVVGVALFFMITGYLFWSRMIAQQGKPDWLTLYIHRVFRIAPLYLCAFIFLFTVMGRLTHWHLHETPLAFIKESVKYGLFGLYPIGDYNGMDVSWVLAGITWTLRYEWWFYSSLPLIALVTRVPKLHLPTTLIATAIAAGYMISQSATAIITPLPTCILLFLLGMSSASLQKQSIALKLPDSAASAIILILLALVFSLFPRPNDGGMQGVAFLLLGLVFYLIANGCSVFGLLTSTPAKRLGDVSYGIYLLQGMVLLLLFSQTAISRFALASASQYWMVVFANAVALIVVATVMHVYIERLGIELGKRVSGRLSAYRTKRLKRDGMRTN